MSEEIVQSTAALGGETDDSRFIRYVQTLALEISEIFAAGLDSGEVSEGDLFDTDYRPVRGSNPQQVLARFTDFTDRHLPALQDPLGPDIRARAALGRGATWLPVGVAARQ